MSVGPRIPLKMAEDAAAWLMRCWGLDPAAAMVVGSVRRKRPDVGDLEIVCPWEVAAADTLFRVLDSSRQRPDALFAPPSDLPPITPRAGLKAGFLECDIVAHVAVQLADGSSRQLDLPVQVARYKPGQRAWRTIMRTGPGDFGRWFLGQWKKQHAIEFGRPASVEGFLVDRHGEPVLLDDERACFARCGVAYLEPERCDEFVAGMLGRSPS